MNDWLNSWLDGIMRLSSSNLPVPVDVVGELNAYLGHSHQYARIKLRIEPAPALEVVERDSLPEDILKAGYIKWAIFGLLDVLMLSKSISFSRIRVVVEEADCDRIECSPMAFRLAGRDAGHKVFKKINDLR